MRKTVILFSIILNYSLLFATSITLNDLRKYQEQFDSNRYNKKVSHFQIYNASLKTVPQLTVIPYGTSINDKKACIVTYASLNPPYCNLVEELKKSLKGCFKGHFLVRKGGWPNMENGCLDHSIVV